MSKAVEAVLSELGWADGFRIPIANADNKRLEEEIEKKTRKRATLRTQLETLASRITEIKKHASDVRQEQNQNQRLLAANASQIETEKHIYGLAQMEASRYNNEIKRDEKDLLAIEDRIKNLQSDIARTTKKLEATKRSIRMDRDCLANWEEKLNRKEEKNLMIEHFVRSDEKSFKKVELERQSLSEKAETYRQAVMKAVADVRESELILNETARSYSQAVKDRRQLMEQWSASVRVLKQRDKAINESRQEINSLRTIAKERMDAYEEAERFYEIQLAENKELEHEIRITERDRDRHRDERRKLTEAVDALSIELVAKNKELQEISRRVADTRADTKRKRNDMAGRKKKLYDCKKMIDDLRETLKNIDWQTINVEERTKQLQDMLEKENKRKGIINREIKRQQDLIARANARLRESENEQKIMTLQLEGETKRWDQLLAEETRQKKLLKDKKECAYQADIELQRCELRLRVITGQENDKDALEAKQAKYKRLSVTLQDKLDTSRMLQAQVAQVENDVRKLTNEIASNNVELARLGDKRQELCLLLDGGDKQLRAARTSYEDRQVDNNILRLKLREVERIASKVDGKLYNLEKFALEMDAAMQERLSEIRAQKESLGLRKRLAQTECAELRVQLIERRSKIVQLQTRHGMIIACLGANNENGAPLTSAYLKIQSAQERYLLQERGDQLDRAIRKTEHEIRSMENTLKLVNACNAKFKSSLSIADEGSDEMAEQERLDVAMARALDTLDKRRNDLERVTNDRRIMEDNCARIDEDVKRIKDEKDDKREQVADLERQINEQREKIGRADKSLRRVIKDVQKVCECVSDETILVYEKDIAVRELQELNQLALQRVAEFVIRHVEAEAYVKKLLDERGIELPAACYQLTMPGSSRSATNTVISHSSSRSSRIAGSHVGPVKYFEVQFDGLESAKSSSSRAPSRSSLRPRPRPK